MRVLIVDDEEPARRKLRRLLIEVQDAEVVAEAGDGLAAVDAILEKRPDLVFLDIQMPRMDGLEVVEQVGVEEMPYTVFVTAHDAYAVRAFEVRALDYLLKPVRPHRFHEALERVRMQLHDGHLDRERLRLLLADLERTKKPLSRLYIRAGSSSRLVDMQDVERLEAQDNYVAVHACGEKHLTRSTLKRLEERLDEAEFVRISRSDIVRIDAIRRIEPWFHGDQRVVLRSGAQLSFTRRYWAKHRGRFTV